MKLQHLLFILILTTMFACGTSFGKKMEFGNLEIFYSQNVPAEYVKSVGDYFVSNDLVLDHKHSIKLTSDHDSFILKLILNTDYEKLPENMEHDFDLLESDLKDSVFADVNFKLEICDVNFYPLNLKN